MPIELQLLPWSLLLLNTRSVPAQSQQMLSYFSPSFRGELYRSCWGNTEQNKSKVSEDLPRRFDAVAPALAPPLAPPPLPAAAPLFIIMVAIMADSSSKCSTIQKC
jgi:hypothetical protein